MTKATEDTAAPATAPAATRNKASDPVRLVRHQDGFITDPMDPGEAEKIIAGYRGEYARYTPPKGEPIPEAVAAKQPKLDDAAA